MLVLGLSGVFVARDGGSEEGTILWGFREERQRERVCVCTCVLKDNFSEFTMGTQWHDGKLVLLGHSNKTGIK